MKKLLSSIIYLAIFLSIFKIVIAETDYFTNDKALAQRLEALNNSLKMHFSLNNEVLQIIKNEDSHNKTKIKAIADLYQICSQYIITERSNNPANETYNKNLNSLIETFNKKYRRYQKISLAKTYDSSTNNEINKDNYDYYEEQLHQSNQNYDSYDEQLHQSNQNEIDTEYFNKKLSSISICLSEMKMKSANQYTNELSMVKIILSNNDEEQVKEWLLDYYSGYPELARILLCLLDGSRPKGNTTVLDAIMGKYRIVNGKPSHVYIAPPFDSELVKKAFVKNWKERNSDTWRTMPINAQKDYKVAFKYITYSNNVW